MGHFHYLKAGQWGMFTDEGNQNHGKLIPRQSIPSAFNFLQWYKWFARRTPEAADPAVREVVHFRMQVMCEEHGLSMDELWNSTIRETCRGKDEDENCQGK